MKKRTKKVSKRQAGQLSSSTLLKDEVEAFTTRKNVYVGTPVYEETKGYDDGHRWGIEGTGRRVVSQSLIKFLRVLCPYKDGYVYEISVRRVKWTSVRGKYERALKSGKVL